MVMPLASGASSVSADDFQRPVVVAMAVVGMVQTAIHQIADMAAMRDGLVSASGAMDMAGLVTEAVIGDGCALLRVLVGHFDHMLIHVVFMRMVKMAIVKIVHMIIVAYGRMTATGAMDMRMVLMLRIRASRH